MWGAWLDEWMDIGGLWWRGSLIRSLTPFTFLYFSTSICHNLLCSALLTINERGKERGLCLGNFLVGFSLNEEKEKEKRGVVCGGGVDIYMDGWMECF